MPKLREYVKDLAHDIVSTSSKQTLAAPTLGSQYSRDQPVKLELDATPGQQTRQVPTTSLANEQFLTASKKLHDAFSKRVREHGPRRFRWPDGSLQPEKPPPNPYAAANRRKWAPLVRHCREHGGDRVFETTGQSFRYNLNVPPALHVDYLKQADLEPEIDDNGEFNGFNPNAVDPLKDPEHALNSFYKEGAAEVFKDKRGRLL